MTNEEALRLIRTEGRTCFVIWSLTRNEIVTVRADHAGVAPKSAESWPDALDGESFMGRYLEPATVTLDLLDAQQEQNARQAAENAEQVSIFRQWHDGPLEALLHLLETGVFPSVVAQGGPRFILDEIYYARAPFLSPQHIERLNAIAARRFFSPFGSANAYRLECRLAVIDGDRQRLLGHWDGLSDKERRGHYDDFVLAAGDLQIDRHDILDRLVGTVTRDAFGMFALRLAAIVALGKIGAAAGEPAAAAIEQHIYDSDDMVAALRRLAIARIRTAPADWKNCESCVRGRVMNPNESQPWFVRCAACWSLGLVPVRAATVDVSRYTYDRDAWW